MNVKRISFSCGYDVDGIWVWSVVCSGAATSVSTLFPSCVWLPQGFMGCRKFWQAFFELFLTVLLGIQPSRKPEFRPGGTSQRAIDALGR
jgi:hypothetical protein